MDTGFISLNTAKHSAKITRKRCVLMCLIFTLGKMMANETSFDDGGVKFPESKTGRKYYTKLKNQLPHCDKITTLKIFLG